MQLELETLVWDRKELEGHLQNAIKECKMMESMLAELEDENDKAMAKIELLEGEVNIILLQLLDKLCLPLWLVFLGLDCECITIVIKVILMMLPRIIHNTIAKQFVFVFIFHA